MKKFDWEGACVRCAPRSAAAVWAVQSSFTIETTSQFIDGSRERGGGCVSPFPAQSLSFSCSFVEKNSQILDLHPHICSGRPLPAKSLMRCCCCLQCQLQSNSIFRNCFKLLVPCTILLVLQLMMSRFPLYCTGNLQLLNSPILIWSWEINIA